MYMNAEKVGVAQLRQGLSAYLRRIEAGERFVVTDRNREVATLGPVARDVREELVAAGRLIPGSGDWRAVKRVPADAPNTALSDALAAVRAD